MFDLRLFRVIIIIMLIIPVTVITPPRVVAASEAIGVNLIVNNFLNDSDAKALAWLVFDGSKPAPSQVDNLVFEWYAPDGSVAFTDVVDPDSEAVAWSYFHVDGLGEWSVNVSYEGNTSIWNNKSFDAVKDRWGPGVYYVKRTTLVSFNAMLTIEPGTTVKFDEGKGLGVEGKLIAQGTESEPIIFSSNLSTKSPGDWSSITFFNSSDDTSILDNVKIEYSREGLKLMEASLLVANSTFINNKENAIYAELSHSHIINNHILGGVGGISPWGIYSAGSKLTLEKNIIQNMSIGLYFLNSNPNMNASITMQENLIENCNSYGMFMKNSTIYSSNDKFIGNKKGVLMEAEADALFEKLTITGGSEGFTAQDESRATLQNSTVSGMEIATFVLSGDSVVILINCSFITIDSNPGVSIDAADGSILVVRNFLTVEAISFDNGTSLPNANVNVYDGAILLYQVNTDVNGLTPQLVVTDRVYMPTLIENITRVHVSRGNLSFQNNNRSVAMNTSHTEIFLGSVHEFNETDTVPPFVVSHYPTSGEAVLNIVITMTFSEAMQKNTVEENFSISPYVAGNFTWVDNTFIFIPQDLINNTFYTVTMGAYARDLANNSMLSPYQFSFTTTDIIDTTPPEIIDIYPSGSEVPVDIQYINITFSEEMLKSSTESAFSIKPRIPGIFSWVDETLRFHPIFELSELTTYTVTINGSRARDIADNTLDGNANGIAEGSPTDDYFWQLRTVRIDFTPPTITKVYPTGDVVDINPTFKIYFSEGINITSVYDAFSFTNGTVTWTSAHGTWGKSKYIMTFKPSSPIGFFQTVTVTINSTVKDLIGNNLDGNGNGIAEGSPIDDYSWSFRTIYDPLIGLPTINEVSPIGINVTENHEIFVNFSQEMDHNSVKEAFTITDGTSVWDKDDGTFMWNENRTYFIPNFAFIHDTVYTIRINNTATNSFGYPLDGNENFIPEDYTLDAYAWSFKTDHPELMISFVSTDGEDASNGSRIWYIDAGGTLLIGVNVTNTGHFSTGMGFNVSLYNLRGIGEPLNLYFNPLAVGEDSGTSIFLWTAPTSIGDHFVEITVDPENKISEVNEDNNTFIIHYAIGPDYIPFNMTVNGIDASDPSLIWYADLGVPFEIGAEAKNVGFSGVSPDINYSIAFWNSTILGELVGPTPFWLITDLPGLGAKESSGYRSAFWYVPNQARDFYITIIIDYDGSTPEIDENNNVFSLHLAFLPDYAISSILVDGKSVNDPKLSWNATAQVPVAIGMNATNLGSSGISDSTQCNISFYNSTRKGVPLESPFFKMSIPGLDSGEDSGEVVGQWLPPNRVGDYYVSVRIDPEKVISEKDEKNNLFTLYFRIGPDIKPTAVHVKGIKVTKSPSPPIYVGLGEIVNIEVNASNLGFSGTGTDFYLAIYNGTRLGKMLEQPYINTSILGLNAFGMPGYDSGAIYASWPAAFDQGVHYVIIYADISQLCDESSEMNNYFTLTFVISPDLIPDNITVDGLPISSYANKMVTLLPGQSIQIGSRTRNIGDSSTGILQFAIAFYNSTSLGINLEPEFMYQGNLGPLGADAFTSDVYALWCAPYPSKPTEYYINISIDSQMEVSETDEINNFYVLHIKVNAPDLTPDRVVIESDGGEVYHVYEDPFALGFVTEEIYLSLGMDITITIDFKNVGGLNQTYGTNVTFYNTSTLFGPQNGTPFYVTSPSWVLLKGSSYPAWDQTSELGQTMIVRWASPGVYGPWYINITVDLGNSITEFNEHNNTFTLHLNVTDYPITTLRASEPSYSGISLYVDHTTELNLSVIGENPPYYTWCRIINLTSGSMVRPWFNYTEEGSNITMIWGSGAFKIEYNSTDALGKKESIKSQIVIVDEEPPDTNIIIGDPTYYNFVSDVINITSSTYITLSANDKPLGESAAGFGIMNSTGVESIYYRIQNVSSGSYVTDWILISEGVSFYLDSTWGDGNYLIWYNSTDNLGHKKSPESIYVYLDNSPPRTIITIGQPNWTAGPMDRVNVTYETQFTIQSLEFEGSMTNTSSISFRINCTDQGLSSDWRLGSTFDIEDQFYLGDGNYTIEYRSRDNLGNIDDIGILFIYVDGSEPEIHLNLGEPKYREFTLDPYNISRLTPINITCEDGWGCGVADIEYRITNASNDSGWIPYSVEFNLTGYNDGLYTIHFRASDNLGNSATKSIEIYLDTTVPSMTLGIGDPKFRSETSHAWNITSLTTIELISYYENGSGVSAEEYRIYNSTFDTGWQPYTGSFNLSGLGDDVYFLDYRNIDYLGNTNIGGTATLRLDNSAPITHISITGKAYRQGPNDRWNVTGSTVFMKSAEDGNGSGVNAIMHRILSNDTGFYYTGWLSSESFTLDLADGNYTVEFYAVDNLSNIGDIGQIYLYLDNTPPRSSISVGDPKYRQWHKEDWRVSGETQFTLQGFDGSGSGLGGIYYSLWNDTNEMVISSNLYTQPFNISGLGGDGFYIIRYWAEDHVGNIEIKKEINLILDTTPPSIMSTTPKGTGNSIFTYIQVVFTEEVNQDSVKEAFSYSDGLDAFDYEHGIIKWYENTMTFYPYENFCYDTGYLVTINTTASDLVGNRLDGSGNGIFEGASDIHTWIFSTSEKPDYEPPMIVDVYPSMNAQAVPIDATIMIEFSEAMNEISIEEAFSYSDSKSIFSLKDGIFKWTGNTITFTPAQYLSYDTEYTVTISNSASDISGNILITSYIWNFKTERDNTPPIIIACSPKENDVRVNTTISMTFNKPMDRPSVENSFFVIPHVNGSFEWLENKLIFTPVSSLAYSTTYYITMGIEAKDAFGNAMEFPYQFNFITEPDIYPPEVISHFPTGIEVDINVNITITFNEAMQQPSVQESFSVEPFVEGVFSWQDNTLIFTPTILSNSTLYTVEIGGEAKDLAGNSLQSPYQFSFTTKKDPYPPFILEVEPTGENVSLNSVIRVTFSESMDQSSLYGALQIEPYLPGTMFWEEDILVFKPNGKLLKNTVYNVTISKSAKDLVGNSMIEDYSWEFETEGDKPTKTELFPWNLFFLWLVSIVFIVLILWMFYQFRFKRRKEKEEYEEEEEEYGEEDMEEVEEEIEGEGGMEGDVLEEDFEGEDIKEEEYVVEDMEGVEEEIEGEGGMEEDVWEEDLEGAEEKEVNVLEEDFEGEGGMEEDVWEEDLRGVEE